MSNSETFFNDLLKQGIKNIDPPENEKDAGEKRFIMAILGILLFAGVEGVKITFRKKIGLKAISMVRVIICFLCFLGIGVYSFSLITKQKGFWASISSSDSYFVTTVLCMALALFILIKGLSHRSQAIRRNDFSEHQGDSSILAFLIKKGWKPALVQNFAEPFFILLIGAAYSLYNLLGGITLIACAVSYWLYLLMALIFFPSPLEQRADTLSQKVNRHEQFHEVK